MTTESTFQALLQLPEPWFIAGIDIDAEGEAMHVRIDCRRSAPLACPQCGVACEVYDHASRTCRAGMPGKRQAGWSSLWVTFLLATQEKSDSRAEGARKLLLL